MKVLYTETDHWFELKVVYSGWQQLSQVKKSLPPPPISAVCYYLYLKWWFESVAFCMQSMCPTQLGMHEPYSYMASSLKIICCFTVQRCTLYKCVT